jgi:hypothetical protein
MLTAKQEIAMDFASFTDDALREELEAMRLALRASQSSESEARLRRKIDAAERELDKRDAYRS